MPLSANDSLVPRRSVSRRWDAVPWVLRALGAVVPLLLGVVVACSGTDANTAPAKDPLAVEFTPSGGSFIASSSVSLAVSVPGAKVYYTLDGSGPSAASQLYEAPIELSRSTRVRAVAIAATPTMGTSSGPIGAQTYLRVTADAEQFTSHLPVVVIDTFKSGTLGTGQNEPYVPASFQVFEPRGTHTSLVGRATLDTRIGIHVRGESSRGFSKNQYAVEFRDADDEDLDHPLLGMPAHSDWVLSDPIEMDRSLLRNAFTYEVSNSIGRYAPRTRFVEVFLIDGEDGVNDLSMASYVGLFMVIEKIKRGNGRLDLAKLAADDLTAPSNGGGYIFRIDKGDADFEAAGSPVQFVYPRPERMALPERQPQVDYIRKFINDFSSAANAPNHQHPVTGHHYSEFIDQDSWIDHHILNVLARNPDGIHRSAYFHKNQAGKIVAGPVWDFDRTFGTPEDSRATDPEGWRPSFGYPWWKPLFNDPAFRARYRARVLELLRGKLAPATLEAIIDRLVLTIGGAAERNYQRWPDTPPQTGGQAAEVAIMKAFLRARVAWFESQMSVMPDFRK